jgi:hypothetical protein
MFNNQKWKLNPILSASQNIILLHQDVFTHSYIYNKILFTKLVLRAPIDLNV